MLRARRAIPAVFLATLAPLAIAQAPPPGWVPPSAAALAQHSTFHTEFTFDKAMLRFAGNFLDDGDEGTRQAAAKLDAISVHVYHFSAPGMYNPAILSAIRSECDATGWKHMATAHNHGDPFSAGQTDLWISFSHMQATGMEILLAGEKDVEIIEITGDLSPLDLLHLRGHFGIPKFDADGLVNQPEAKQKAAPAPRPEYQEPAPAPPPPPER